MYDFQPAAGDCLNDDSPEGDHLLIATVHAIKGLEYPHVIVYEYNLFGHHSHDSRQDENQENNLLYIETGRINILLSPVSPSPEVPSVSPSP